MVPNWKIAIRSFWKNKYYTIINITGLAIGLASALLIAVFLEYELNFDRFIPDEDRIYQVVLDVAFGGDEFVTTNTPPPVGEALHEEFPEIESYTRHHMPGNLALRYEDQIYTENKVWMVDSNFIDFFSFPLIEGDAKTCLRGTKSMVITQSISEKYFGAQLAIGKSIYIEDDLYEITGVLKDLPNQSSLQFDVLLPIAASESVQYFSWSWIWLQVDTYVKLNQTFDPQKLPSLEAKFPTLVRQRAANAFKRIGQDLDTYFKEGNRWQLSLNPLSDLHLYSSEVSSRLTTKGSILDIYIFALVGFFILLLAAINFTNLTTAQSLSRTKEVGVRKVLGSKRSFLIQQFLTEALILSLIAGVIAIVLVLLFRDHFGQLMNRSLTMNDIFNGKTFIAIIIFPVVTGLLAGFYPAIFLSGFKPISMLSNRSSQTKSPNTWLKNTLVVFQFAISIALIICTGVVIQQIRYSTSSNLGLVKEQVLILPNANYLNTKAKSFKNELAELPGVKFASITTDLPTTGNAFGDFYVPEAEGEQFSQLDNITLNSYLVDEDFIPAMGIGMVEGRNFGKERGLDSLSVIINEATARLIGWEDPIGKFLRYPGGNNRRYQVIGVMRNFHVSSFYQNIEPFALFHESSRSYELPQSYAIAKVMPGQEQEVVDQAKELWTTFAPQAPFGFSFLEDDIYALYQSEERLGTVLGSFTLLSIFIACLGLLGLITYTIDQKTKEIGIRKVLGASIAEIVGLLSKEFLLLVTLSIFIAAPIAYIVMRNWLQNFAYPVEFQIGLIFLAGALAMVLAFLTISLKSIGAASMNPVDALKNE